MRMIKTATVIYAGAYLVIGAVDLVGTRLCMQQQSGDEANPLSPHSLWGMLLVELVLFLTGTIALAVALRRMSRLDCGHPEDRTFVRFARMAVGPWRVAQVHILIVYAANLLLVKCEGAVNNMMILTGHGGFYDRFLPRVEDSARFSFFVLFTFVATVVTVESGMFLRWKASGVVFGAGQEASKP